MSLGAYYVYYLHIFVNTITFSWSKRMHANKEEYNLMVYVRILSVSVGTF